MMVNMISRFAILWFLAVNLRALAVWGIWNWVIVDLTAFSDMSYGDAVLVSLLLPVLTLAVHFNGGARDGADASPAPPA